MTKKPLPPSIKRLPPAVIKAAARRELTQRSFAEFVSFFWPVVTGNAYVENRVTASMIAALQGVGDGTCSKLVIAKPPGCGASTLLVLFQAWRIARDPSWRTMAASHSFELAGTASRRVRRLVLSDEYQELFDVALRDDAATVGLWETTDNGHFIAVGRDSNVTGRRGNEIVCDDLNAAADKYSKAALEHAWTFFTETLFNRVDNDRSAHVVCAQRVAVDDVIGRLMRQAGWTVVVIPAEDENGEPTAPNVLPRERLDAIKLQIGSTAYACQYLERPADDSASQIKRRWWRFYRASHVSARSPRPAGCDETSPAVELPERFDRVTIAADLTFGSLDGDYAVAQAWGSRGGGRYLLEQWRARAGFEEQVEAIAGMSRRYPGCKVIVEKAANGAAVIETLRKRIAGVIAQKPIGKKAQRLGAIAPTVESGACYLPLGAPWLEDFVEELASATNHDDQCDTTAYAVADLNGGGFEDAPAGGYLFSGKTVIAGDGERTFAPRSEPSDVDLSGELPPSGGFIFNRR